MEVCQCPIWRSRQAAVFLHQRRLVGGRDLLRLQPELRLRHGPHPAGAVILPGLRTTSAYTGILHCQPCNVLTGDCWHPPTETGAISHVHGTLAQRKFKRAARNQSLAAARTGRQGSSSARRMPCAAR